MQITEYATVPKEPTSEMTFAGACVHDQKPSEVAAVYRAMVKAAALSQADPAGGAGQERADLDERMKAAGMIPLSDLLAGNTPLEKWMAHTGVRDLDSFEQWLTGKHREFMTMRVGYELGDKDEADELYEWVFAHAAAFGEVAANFRAMKERSPAPTVVQVKALEWDGNRATSVAGFYAIQRADGEWNLLRGQTDNFWKCIASGSAPTFSEAFEQAKAAAQADYETRIRSALIAPPAAGAQAVPVGDDDEISPYEWLAQEFDRLAILRKMWSADEVAAFLRRHDIERNAAPARSVGEER